MSSRHPFEWRPFAWNNLWAAFSGSTVERERRELKGLYDRVKAAYERSPYAKEDADLDFVIELVDEVERRAGVRLPDEFGKGVRACVYDVTREDPIIFGMPEFPETLSIEASALFRTFLTAKERFLSDPARYEDIWSEKVIRILEGIFGYLPQLSATGPFSAEVYNACDVREVVERLLFTFYDDDVVNAGLFTGIREQFERNLINASGISLEEARRRPGSVVKPTDSTLPLSQIAPVYLRGTAFEQLFSLTVPFSIPEAIRFQHQWVVAPTGSGKTQLLQAQIAEDLKKVAAGGASIVVIDSQGMGEGRLLSNIARLKAFTLGEALADKLVILQPDMGEAGAMETVPPALNLFDMGQYNPDLPARDRQILHTSALKMITFCLSDTTGPQQDMIEYLVQLAMAIPGSTIETVSEMLAASNKEFAELYAEPLSKVDEIVRRYFTTVFTTQSQGITKDAVLRRIMGMLKNPTFRRMYQNERNKLNMQRELDAGKVILINTDLALLGTEACELFGRFFISLLVQATQQRTGDMPVYCYIDECTDYIAADENIAMLIDKARKQKVAFIFSHQRLAHIKSPNVLDALSNCAVQFAGRNRTDAPTLARLMRTEPDVIIEQKTGTFAAFIQGTTPHAVQVQIPGFVMENMEQMSASDARLIREEMREQYCNEGSVRSASSRPAAQSTPPPTGATWDDVV